MTTTMSDRTLLGWLDKNPAKLERYLTEHPEETDRIDALTVAPSLEQELTSVMHPPTDLLERIALRAADTSRREAGEVLGDLFGAAWKTLAVLFAKDDVL